ncbi:MAG TPA: glycosyl hydrolase family 28-related protein, partial [Armatimonadota bacterium]
TGASYLQFNAYDNTFSGCEFQDNAYGVYCYAGNWYIRNCHFERSTTSDVYMVNAHSNSLRRCTSVGSKQFFYQSGSTWMTPICIQDCRVDGWAETTNGAIQLGVGGPDTIFDCVFTNPPNTNPPIKLSNSSLITQSVITSNNVSTGTSSVINSYAYAVVTDIPATSRTIGGCLTSAGQSFLQERVAAEGTVFDAKRDYSAVGNGSADDTTALRNCIAAAKAAGHGAVAYIPSGTYKITGTLTIDGGNYSVCGSGFRTILVWGAGVYTGTIISVIDPQQVRMEQINVMAPNNDDVLYDNVCRIRQTSATGGSSSMIYDTVYVGGMYLSPVSRWLRGIECDSLPEGAVVLFNQVNGSVNLMNCSRARILANVHQGGRLKIEGASYAKTGLAGWLTRVCSSSDYDLTVKDNQDITISDWYTESTDHLANISGDGCTVPGHVTVQATKQNTLPNFFTVANNGGARNNITGCFGYEFTVGSQPLIVRALGRSVATSGGMANSHVVNIWQVSNQTCVASATVTSTSPGDVYGYKFATLGTPVTLAANTTYRIVSDETNAGDKWLDLSTVTGYKAIASITQAVSGTTQGAYPTTTAGSANSVYGAPTFYVDLDININDYTGRIFWGKANFIGNTTFPIVHSGTHALDLLLVGNGFMGAQPTITEQGSGMTPYLLGNLWRNYDQSVPANKGVITDVPTPFDDTAKGKVALALDDFALLGRLDLSVNFPGLAPRPTNQKLWLTAENGVTKDGANYITTWSDQSGQGNHAANGGGSEEPLYQAASLNGKPTINFDGAYNNFSLGSHFLFADNTKTGITFIAVVKSTADR